MLGFKNRPFCHTGACTRETKKQLGAVIETVPYRGAELPQEEDHQLKTWKVPGSWGRLCHAVEKWELPLRSGSSVERDPSSPSSYPTCPIICHTTSPLLCTSTGTGAMMGKPVQGIELKENWVLKSSQTTSPEDTCLTYAFCLTLSRVVKQYLLWVASHCTSFELLQINLFLAELHYWEEDSSVSIWIMNMLNMAFLLKQRKQTGWTCIDSASFITSQHIKVLGLF